ncbi:MAG: HesA/MoeB/ThiF family protein, partial [Candidatus Hodarchaeales archaeon]
VEAAKNNLSTLVPGMTIDAVAANIDSNTIDDILEGIDYVIDGLDSFKPRLVANRRCHEKKIPFLFAGAQGYSANMSTFTYKNNTHPCLACIFSEEVDDSLPKGDVTGVHPSILTVATSIQIAELTKLLTNKSPLLEGRLLLYDLMSLSQEIIDYRRNKQCQVCGSGTVQKIESEKATIVELCGEKSIMVIPAGIKGPLALTEMVKLFKKAGHAVTKSGSYGFTAEISDTGITASIFKGGNILVRTGSTDEAKAVFEKISGLFVTNQPDRD